MWGLFQTMLTMIGQLAASPIAWVPCLIATLLLAIIGLDRVLTWVINFDRFRE